MAPLQAMIDSGLISIAAQPRNNALDLGDHKLERLYVFLIDHDYPGGSAAMHNAVFAHFKLPYRSCFMIGDPARVAEIIAGLRACPIYHGGGAGSGFKDKIAPSLDGLAPSAEVIGSVNVIARDGDRFIGHNTDGIGFVAGLLNEYANCVAGQKVVILGAGGTALPISYELSKEKPREVVIVNRTVAKAQTIADLIAPLTTARAVGEEALGDELADAGLVVNTSNKGAQPNEKFSAFAAMTGNVEMDLAQSMANLARLPGTAIVADILLEELPLTLKLARDAGHRTHSGRHMNLFQAAPAFKILTGLDKPDATLLEIMRKAVE
ncbi:shikimate dehydrogenase [Sphingomonas sp. 28-63-12]|uniref:shikimate dehydrogenase family protein n=1 Tax=Sphingomonas sp. 28-63-12 TaxID=1970434 RepID=UPI0035A98007